MFMLLKDLIFVLKTFKFDEYSETNVGYYISELTIYNDKVRVDIFRGLDEFGNPNEYIRIFKNPRNVREYTIFDFKDFIANPDKQLLDEIFKK
jgi:hypothetical protein